MKRLPLGLQTFSEIITKNYLYIDKTKEIASLIEVGKYFFLSRPRRFGKSLLVSTLKEIFLGSQELFKGLYIHDKIQWEKHPVIHIDFSLLDYKDDIELEKSLFSMLHTINEKYKLSVKKESLKIYFEQILIALAKTTGKKAVVLVDEYDKPIIDFMEEPEKAKANREVLRSFFAVLKGADPYLHFVFLTGVSKFSKVSIFSGLNNLNDITLSANFSTILGLTAHDLKKHFEERMEKLAIKEEMTKEELLKQIKHWYNGYSWDGVNRLYNPTSILKLFFENRFSNYWFATGTPFFLVSTIKKRKLEISTLRGKKVGEYIFESFDIDSIDIHSLLFQTGYLTISQVKKKRGVLQYTLDFPNFEVKESLLNYLLAAFSGKDTSEIQPLYFELLDCLEQKNLKQFITILTSLFASIPYNLHIKDEKYYHSLCYMILTLMGAKIDLKVLSDKGRVDGVLTLDEQIYVIGFKMGTAKEAMKQIKEKKYWQPYLNSGKEVLLLGVGGFANKELEYSVEPAPRHIS